MSEETAAPKAAESSSPVLQVGCAILVIAMAVFVVVTLNNMKKALDTLNKSVTGIQEVTSGNSLAAFEIQDETGKVVMKFASKPMDAMDAEGSGAGDMSGGTCPSPAPDK